MNKEIDRFQDASKITPAEKPERIFTNKPVFSALISIVLGVAMVMIPGVFTRIIGALPIIGALYILFIYRSRKVLSFYKEGVVVYRDMDDAQGLYFPYSQISRWAVNRSNYGTQHVVLFRKDQDYVYAETPDIRPVRNVLRRYMPDKEYKVKEGNR